MKAQPANELHAVRSAGPKWRIEVGRQARGFLQRTICLGTSAICSRALNVLALRVLFERGHHPSQHGFEIGRLCRIDGT
jgi:hypothetical protein